MKAKLVVLAAVFAACALPAAASVTMVHEQRTQVATPAAAPCPQIVNNGAPASLWDRLMSALGILNPGR